MSYCTVCGNGTENFDRSRIKGERCEGCGTPRESLVSKLFPVPGAPAEDPAVLALCLAHGFGAVMSSASRQWIARDPVGALTVGPTVHEVLHPEKYPVKSAPESEGLDLEALLLDQIQKIAEFDQKNGRHTDPAALLRLCARRLRAGAEGEGMGYALAMRVRQSDLYALLDDTERVECDALIQAEARRLRAGGK